MSSVLPSQDHPGVSQQQEATSLFVPELNHLRNQANFLGEDTSEAGPTIPTQHSLTHQILQHCQPFRDLNLEQTFGVSCRAEQLRLRVQKRVEPQTGPGPQEEDVPRRDLWFKSMS